MATTQTRFGQPHPQSEITVSVTGEVQYPNVVGGYERTQSRYGHTTYAAPAGIKTDRGLHYERLVWVAIREERNDSGYKAMVQVGTENFSKFDDHATIEKAQTEAELAQKTVEWMKAHPAPLAAEVFRPELGDADRRRMHKRSMADQIGRIRVGSMVRIDALPPARVVAELDANDLAPTKSEGYIAELPNGETIHFCRDSIGLRDVLAYAGELTEYGARTAAKHVSVSNETNLREEVHTETYEWLKERQGETVIKQTDDHSFNAVDVEELRDGFLNPTDDGELDPDSRHGGTFIDDSEAGQWFENPLNLASGSYRVVKRGIVELNDTYAGDIIVPAAEWDEAMPFGDPETAHEIDAGIETVTTDNRDGLSRTGTVTDITGVGDATAEDFWRTELGDLYHAGFPAVHIPAQYHEQAIADLHTLTGSNLYPSDACRAIVGILGGVGYNAEGVKIATAASMISGTAEPNDMEVGWLSQKHDLRIKAGYTPSWLTGNGPNAVAAGRLSTADLSDGVTTDGASPAIAVRENPTNDDLVGVVAKSGAYVEVGEKPLRVMAAVANIDLSDMESDQTNVTVYPDGTKEGEGVILLNDAHAPFNAIIDTEGIINPDDVVTPD